MTGTLLNVATVLLGGGLGLAFGARLPDRVRGTVVAGLGLFTFAMGLRMFTGSENPLIPLGSILLGAILGEWWRIEDRLLALGARLEARFGGAAEDVGQKGRFIQGFLAASLLFCVGPMTILGSIQDGLQGDYSLLAIKSVLDGFAALALASTLGVGVLFSVVVVFTFQGGISLLAAQANAVLSAPMIAEMTAAGGIILLGLSVGSLLELRPIRAGNMLPALLLAPLIVWIIQLVGSG
ncbi:MAG TPA: DUF554 domain-containing protein [Anaerolineales bacterium]|nr:DUF554 domain-containing protein [Anaerolineales bacterium]